MHLLSINVDASAVRAVVLDGPAAGLLGPVTRVPFDLHHPTPEAAEVLPEDLWSALTAAARQACRDFPDVMGVGLAVVAPWLVLLDQADQPLVPLWTHHDLRARTAARQVWAAVGPELLTTTGNRPIPGLMSALNYRQQLNDDPYLSHRVCSYLSQGGWLALRISGQRAFDPASACLTGLFGTLTDHQWSPRWCDYFEVEAAWLPPVQCGSTTIGTVRSAVAAELGVPAGIPLKLGTTFPGTALLAGAMNTGDLLHHIGGVQSLAALASDPKPSPRLMTHLLGVGDGFLQMAHNPVGGVAIEWVRKLCFQDQGDGEFFERTLPLAFQRTPRELFDPPCLAGDPLEIEAYRAAFRDLTLTTDRLDLLCAVVQAMLRGHRQALDALGAGRARQRTLLSGSHTELMRDLLPGYAAGCVETLVEAPLRGVARLFEFPTLGEET